MAVLNKIRQRSVFLIIIIAMALFAFVLADVIQNGGFSSQKSQNTLATVNGMDIPREEFARKVEATLRNLGPTGTNAQAMNIAWDNELRRVLLQEQYDKLGIRAESNQIQAALEQSFAANPEFQTPSGALDFARVQQYIANVRATAPEQYAQWVDGLKQQAYMNMIQAGVGASLAEGALEYRLDNDNVSIRYVQVPYTSVSDDTVPVSEAEIEAYIKKHPKQFETEAAVDIQYVLFAEEPSETDLAEIRNELETLKSDRLDFNTLTQTNDTLPGLASATDLHAFVAQHSEGTYEDAWRFKNQLPREQADKLFELAVGDIYGSYQTENSFHLTKLIDEKQLSDSIKVSHIMLVWEGMPGTEGVTRTEEETKQLADSLLNVARGSGADFETLALQFSDDPNVTNNKGDLGYVGPGNIGVKEFDDYITNNPKGSKGVVKSELGYHLISIEDKNSPKRAVKVATISKTVHPSEDTAAQLFTVATQFEQSATKGDFVEAAQAGEYNVRPVNKIGNLQENIPGIGNNRSLVTWAYEKSTKPGDIKRFSLNSGGYAIVQLTAKHKAGLMSVAEASAQVTPILRNRKKVEQISRELEGKSLDEIAEAKNTQVRSASALNLKSPTIADAGTEPKVVGTALGMKAGETSGFIQGEKGVYKVTVTAINPAAERENFDAFVRQIDNRQRARIASGVFQALKDKADIDDRRATFY